MSTDSILALYAEKILLKKSKDSDFCALILITHTEKQEGYLVLDKSQSVTVLNRGPKLLIYSLILCHKILYLFPNRWWCFAVAMQSLMDSRRVHYQ